MSRGLSPFSSISSLRSGAKNNFQKKIADLHSSGAGHNLDSFVVQRATDYSCEAIYSDHHQLPLLL